MRALLVDAEQLAKDRGGSMEARLGELTTRDLVEFRYQLAEQWGDADKLSVWLQDSAPEGATIQGVVWHLLQLVEHEIGGRWVKPH